MRFPRPIFAFRFSWSRSHTRYGLHSESDLISRPDATVYIAGENSIPHSSLDRSTTLSNHLPADPSQVIDLVDQSLVDRLLRSAVLTSPLLNIKRGAELVKAQLCYRPSSPDGNPLIGRLGMQKEEEGVYVAAGHGPWVSGGVVIVCWRSIALARSVFASNHGVQLRSKLLRAC